MSDILDSERVRKIREKVDSTLHMVDQIAPVTGETVDVLLIAMNGVIRALATGGLSHEATRLALCSLHEQLEATVSEDATDGVLAVTMVAFTKNFAVGIQNMLPLLPLENQEDAQTNNSAAMTPPDLSAPDFFASEEWGLMTNVKMEEEDDAPLTLLSNHEDPPQFDVPDLSTVVDNAAMSQSPGGVSAPRKKRPAVVKARAAKEPAKKKKCLVKPKALKAARKDSEDGKKKAGDGGNHAARLSLDRAQPRKQSPKRESCTLCGEEFGAGMSARKRHVYRKHLKQPRLFSCPVCPAFFNCDDNARQHMKAHHKNDGVTFVSHETLHRQEIAALNDQCFPSWQHQWGDSAAAKVARRQSETNKRKSLAGKAKAEKTETKSAKKEAETEKKAAPVKIQTKGQGTNGRGGEKMKEGD